MIAADAVPEKTHRAKGDTNERQPKLTGWDISPSNSEFNVRITEHNRAQQILTVYNGLRKISFINARGRFSRHYFMGFTSEPQVRYFSFRPRTSSCGQLVSHRIITKKAIHKTLQKISDDSDVSGESIYSPINLGPSAKIIIIYLDMNKLLIIVLLIVLGMSTRLHHLGNSPCYRFDEGPKGHRCKNSNGCDGRRTCSPFGWCQGTA